MSAPLGLPVAIRMLAGTLGMHEAARGPECTRLADQYPFRPMKGPEGQPQGDLQRACNGLRR